MDDQNKVPSSRDEKHKASFEELESGYGTGVSGTAPNTAESTTPARPNSTPTVKPRCLCKSEHIEYTIYVGILVI